MKIMVFDVPAESGGALFVLTEFYNEFIDDHENQYYLVISKPMLNRQSNITVLRYPWIKKSWIHRLYFDHFIAHRLIIENNIEEVLSLQNTIIPHTSVKQTVYVHNFLAFSEYRFSILRNKILWFNQNVISWAIFKSIRSADKVQVQTHWFKQYIVEHMKVDPNKIEVVALKITCEVKQKFVENRKSLSTFFYPASGYDFKNHKIIVDACKILKGKGYIEYLVLFTLEKSENKLTLMLNEIIKNNQLPISMVGNIDRDKVFEYYSRSILLFPSYIETVGLPLIEARMHECPIIAADCAYAHEILVGYDKSKFFPPFDAIVLANQMEEIIKQVI